MVNIFKKASLTNLTGNPQVTSHENKIQELNDQIKFYEHLITQLQAITSAMPDPYYVRDMDYNIVLWPAAIAKLMGYTEADAKRMKCYDIFKACVCPPEGQCPTTQCIRDNKFLKDVAVDVYKKDGEVIHSLVSNAGVYDRDGSPLGAVEIVKDNTSVQKAMAAISETIKKIDFASANLNAATEMVNNISKKVSENTSDSLAGIKKGVEAGNGADKKAGDSAKNAGDVQENMNNINESMKFSIEKIAALKEKSARISEFIDVIQQIAAKTNLLAINASIEAAHAGEAGRGFKVVADGIRELSKNSQESALSIQATIKEINDLVSETTSSMNVTGKDIESGTETISGLLAFVNEITQSIKEIMFSMQTIESAAVTTSGLINEQNNSVSEVSSISRELSSIANELTDRVRNTIKYGNMG